MEFPKAYTEILNRIDEINPVEYGHTRNYAKGNITYLSPYISRGVISTRQVLDVILTKGYKNTEIKKLVQQLAWREYFQRAWQYLQDDLFDDILHRYNGVQHKKIPTAILNAKTGIHSIDNAILELYQTGYMHNHLRLYVASITCNIAKSDWQLPSHWMYYHLLDGDLASNNCSWQWVTGNFSSRQYFCNQENINKFTNTNQTGTFLDKTYEELPQLKIPEELSQLKNIQLTTSLPKKEQPKLDTSLPLVIYTSYNLDPLWKQDIKANRVLLLEPSHFKQFPVSENVMNFITGLAKNIEGLQIFSGELNELTGVNNLPAIYSKEHPFTKHFPGIKEERDWIFPEVTGYFNSFFQYWKQCEKILDGKEHTKFPNQMLKAS